MADSHIFCFGFGPWKFGFVRAYLARDHARAAFCTRAWQARLRGFDAASRLVVWGLRERPDVTALSERFGVPIWRMEDGFLRSVGLGSDFNMPSSLVLDRRGIYFDPRTASDLEVILETGNFDAAELRRAALLREAIVRASLSKYNFAPRTAPLNKPKDKKVILVPGQVEDDASIRFGCVDIRSNEELLLAVRRANPDAHLVFKPHPDLLRGNRKVGALDVRRARELCDELIEEAPLPACLAIADEVHTMTSLVGFEALLRGLSVTTYGLPFYAGWGLTRDRHAIDRRTRRLSLDELVGGALIRYPMYMSRATRQLTTPEVVIEELRDELRREAPTIREHRLKRQLRKLGHAVRGMLHGP